MGIVGRLGSSTALGIREIRPLVSPTDGRNIENYWNLGRELLGLRENDKILGYLKHYNVVHGTNQLPDTHQDVERNSYMHNCTTSCRMDGIVPQQFKKMECPLFILLNSKCLYIGG